MWWQGTPLGLALRSAGVWSYAVINLAHILGIATLLGSVLILDLRLLGLWRTGSLNAIVAATVPLSCIGFALAVASGLCMLATNGSEYIGNPFLVIKFTAIGIALANVAAFNALPSWRHRAAHEFSPGDRRMQAALAGISLACWLTAVSAGRLIGYW